MEKAGFSRKQLDKIFGTKSESTSTEFIKGKEGFRENAYWDVSRWSIGYGTPAKKGDKISQDDALTELENETAKIDKVLSKKITIDLPQESKTALTSFLYNLGLGIFDKPSSQKLLKAINDKDKKEIEKQYLQFNKVRKNGKLVANKVLTGRRKDELELLLAKL